MEQSATIFSSIATELSENKKLFRLATSCAKSFKSTVQSSLEKANELAFWLYIYGHKSQALSVCEVVERIPFTGSFNIWSWVEITLTLKSRILKEMGKDDEVRKTIALVTAVYEGDEDEGIRASRSKELARRLGGGLLKDAAIEDAIREKDTRTEKDYRFVNLRELIFITEFGNKANSWEEQIQQNVRRLQ